MSEAKKVNLNLIESCGYTIHKNGTIFSQISGRFLKHSILLTGYSQVALYLNGKKTYYLIHRLVAEKYIHKQEGKDRVNHMDAKKTNNSAHNLEWVTCAENSFHAVHGSHEKRDGLFEMAKLLRSEGRSLSAVAKATGLSIATVSRISNGSRDGNSSTRDNTERRRRIGIALVSKGRQQKRVANIFGVSEATVSRWVNGKQ
ncbi:hypothetical protein B4900_10840 [Yersinia rohdei]|nr:hypothetical protein B4900_10840 [Yersinia rohdei]